MKLKMLQVLTMKSVFSKLVNERMPVRLAYKISKIVEAIDKESLFYQTELDKLIAEFSEKGEDGEYLTDESGKTILIVPEHLEHVRGRIAELEDLDVDFPDQKIGLDELEKFNFTVLEFNSLIPILEEE